jgi:ceramide glucosyltransferase
MSVLAEYTASHIFAEACEIGAVTGCIYLLFAAAIALRFKPEDKPRNSPTVPVTILKPLHGDEPGLYRRLAAFCDQSYGGPVQVVFGCNDCHDPAIATVRRLQKAPLHAAINLTIGGSSDGSNRKICNLMNMEAVARHAVFVISDSDIEAGASYLADVVSALEKPGVGAVTCFYHGVGNGTVPAQLSALAINTLFLPQVLVAMALGLGRPCFGATIALHRDVLRRIGDFHSFANCLADDHAIGEAVRAAGYGVAIPHFLVGHLCTERTFTEFFARHLRHGRTIKSINPAGYAGAFITNPLPLALAAMLAGAGGHLVGAAIVCRILLSKAIERTFRLSPQRVWLLPAVDLALFAVFILSFLGCKITWRGYRYRILSGGKIAQDQTGPRSV